MKTTVMILAAATVLAACAAERQEAATRQTVGQWRSLVAARGAWARVKELLVASPPAPRHTELPTPSGDLAVENGLRNPKRTAGTAAALMIGVGLVSLILVLTSSTKESFLRVLQRVVTADYVIGNSDFRRGGFGPEVEQRLGEIPGVESVSRLRRGARGRG